MRKATGEPEVKTSGKRIVKTRLVLLGPPASGKGTQAALIKAHYGIEVASTGTILRQEARRGTPLGLEADRLTRDGGLVPDSMVLGLIAEWLQPGRNAFVFDGFPRTVAQAEALETLLAERRLPLELVIFLNVPGEEIRRRVLGRVVCRECGEAFQLGHHVASPEAPCPVCGGTLYRRSDDDLPALERRMKEYVAWTQPLISFYQERGLLVEIAGESGAETVFSRIAGKLEEAE